MADMMMLVDTAVIVPVNCIPLIDWTDFKTVEDAVAYNATGIDLRWNFVTAAGVQTSTAVTPTTSGSYDWTHLGDGIYSMEIPASGGASANNDTEGFGWWSGKVDGVLPFRGPIIQFSPANVVNSLVVGSDLLDVNTAQVAGTTQSSADMTGELAKVPKSDSNVTWNATALASVKTQAVAALNTDTYAEPGQGAPAATATLVAKIGYLYKFLRNKKTQTATTLSVYDDAGTTVDQKATISDDGTTYTHGEIGSGP